MSLPERFGRYNLVRRLASGGMGEVFLARLEGPAGFEKHLVLKRVLAEHADKPEFIDMFFTEARLAAKLQHRNIVQIFEMGRIGGAHFLAMEHVHGRSLHDLRDRAEQLGEAVPVAHVVELFAQVCDGLAYAHNLSDHRGALALVHRDVTPRNILVSYAGEAKVIDFGIAKSRLQYSATGAGVIKGKLAYMSPEQATARPVDKRSDQFSLGICLYELCTFAHPFFHEDPILTFDAIQRTLPPPMAWFDSRLAPLDPIVARALEKNPARRYADLAEMAEDLRDLVARGAVPSAAQSLGDYLQRLLPERASFRPRRPPAIVLTDCSLGSLAFTRPWSGSEGRCLLAVRQACRAVQDGAALVRAWAGRQWARANLALQASALHPTRGSDRGRLRRHASCRDRRRGTVGPLGLPALVTLACMIGITCLGSVRLYAAGVAAGAPAEAAVDPSGSGVSTSGLVAYPETIEDEAPAPARSTAESPPPAAIGGARAEVAAVQTRLPPRLSAPVARPAAAVRATPLRPSAVGRFGRIKVRANPSVTLVAGSAAGNQLPLAAKRGSAVLDAGRGTEAAFVVRLEWSVDGDTLFLRVDARPWAIVRTGWGAGVGRTPVLVNLGAEPLELVLVNPAEQRHLSLTLEYER